MTHPLMSLPPSSRPAYVKQVLKSTWYLSYHLIENPNGLVKPRRQQWGKEANMSYWSEIMQLYMRDERMWNRKGEAKRGKFLTQDKSQQIMRRGNREVFVMKWKGGEEGREGGEPKWRQRRCWNVSTQLNYLLSYLTYSRCVNAEPSTAFPLQHGVKVPSYCCCLRRMTDRCVHVCRTQTCDCEHLNLCMCLLVWCSLP